MTVAATRPLWMVAYAVVCLPFLVLFARFERGRSRREGAPIAVWRLIAGSAITCTGLALLALGGVGGDGWLGLRVVPLLLTFAGAALAGIVGAVFRFRDSS